MQEIAPGLWHWSARHPKIGIDVSSYLLAAERVVIDPMIPAEGLERLGEQGTPQHALRAFAEGSG